MTDLPKPNDSIPLSTRSPPVGKLVEPTAKAIQLIRESTNSRQSINKLPDEVLSRIFVLCQRITSRERGRPNLFCLLVPQSICRHWRKVALETKALWSLVTLFDSPPFHFSALCLSRSGIIPLNIEILISEKFLGVQSSHDQHTAAPAIIDALNFIVVCGGTTSRWRSFRLYSPKCMQIDPQIAALDFVVNHPMPNLRRLEVRHDNPSTISCSEKKWGDTLCDKPLLHDPPPARLKTVILEWIPNSCLFSNPDRPQLVGLTYLELKFPIFRPKLEHLHALLAASPMLRVLSIDTRLQRYIPNPIRDDGLGAELVHLPKLNMPNLRVLGLLFASLTVHQSWERSFLLMLEAPNVKSLCLWLDGNGASGPDNRDIIGYLTKGTNLSCPKPLFPCLTVLGLFIEPYRRPKPPHFDNLDGEVLSAYPAITTLIMPCQAQYTVLSTQPWLIPSLKTLAIHVKSDSELEWVITERCRAEVGPKLVDKSFGC